VEDLNDAARFVAAIQWAIVTTCPPYQRGHRCCHRPESLCAKRDRTLATVVACGSSFGNTRGPSRLREPVIPDRTADLESWARSSPSVPRSMRGADGRHARNVGASAARGGSVMMAQSHTRLHERGPHGDARADRKVRALRRVVAIETVGDGGRARLELGRGLSDKAGFAHSSARHKPRRCARTRRRGRPDAFAQEAQTQCVRYSPLTSTAAQTCTITQRSAYACGYDFSHHFMSHHLAHNRRDLSSTTRPQRRPSYCALFLMMRERSRRAIARARAAPSAAATLAPRAQEVRHVSPLGRHRSVRRGLQKTVQW